MARPIHPIATQQIRIDPDPHGDVPPPIHEQIATLAEVQETALSTPASAPARQDALAKIRDLLARLGVREGGA